MLAAFVGTWQFVGFVYALGILAGGGWGCANLYFLDKLLQEWLRGGKRSKVKFYTMVGLKFPFLYAIGFLILKIDFFSVIPLILGFSLIFISIILFGIKSQFSEVLEK